MMRVSEVVKPGAPEDGTQLEPGTFIGCGDVWAQRPPLTDSTVTVLTPMRLTVTCPVSYTHLTLPTKRIV